MSVSYAEVALMYGGTFSVSEQLDLVLVVDTPSDPAATQQWLDLMLATSPRLYDDKGTPIARGDDICNQTFGGGLRALVGQLLTNEIINERTAAIQAQIALNPQIAPTPTPVVTIVDLGGGAVKTTVVCYTIAGQRVIANKTTNIFGG